VKGTHALSFIQVRFSSRLLHFASYFLFFQALFDDMRANLAPWLSYFGLHGHFVDPFSQLVHGILDVLPLRAMHLAGDDQLPLVVDAVFASVSESFEYSGRDPMGFGEIYSQLRLRVYFVHVLSARPAGTRKSQLDLTFRDVHKGEVG